MNCIRIIFNVYKICIMSTFEHILRRLRVNLSIIYNYDFQNKNIVILIIENKELNHILLCIF